MQRSALGVKLPAKRQREKVQSLLTCKTENWWQIFYTWHPKWRAYLNVQSWQSTTGWPCLLKFLRYVIAFCSIFPFFLIRYEIATRPIRAEFSLAFWLIVSSWKFDVLLTNICPRGQASRANMLVLRTSNFQEATIRPIVPRHKHSIVFSIHH